MWDWDEPKRLATLLLRGLDFAMVRDFDLDTAVIDPDDRRDYGEAPFKATGMISGRLFIAIFTPRGERFRLISLRKANEREKRAWANR
jgi:uncharacterized DUF497 family protein